MIDTVLLIRHIRENLAPNAIQVFLCYVFGFLCLLPLYYDPGTILEDSILRASLSSVGYRYSSVATLTLAIPFMFDLVTDLVFKPKDGKESNEKTIVKEGFLNNTEKMLFLIGIVMLPMVAFFPESTINWAFIYVCCNKCQQVLIFGAVVISLSRYDNSAWTDKATYITITTLGTGNVMLCNVSNLLPRISLSTYQDLEIIAMSLVIISALVYIFSAIRWLRESYKKKYLLPSKTQKVFKLFYPLIYNVMNLSCIITLIVLVTHFKYISMHNEAAILINNLIYFSYILFIIFLSMRMVKSEVVQGLYALIESKKVYVRYISHELRTPLNAGLKLLTDDFQASTDPKDADRNDILSDANSACRIALDILNDLLCFDKLENGVLVLHKQEEPVLPFISDCVSMFSSQARECGVNLSIIRPDLRNYTDSALKATDIAVMDKFKMDQVLRNLISNALKFTPRGGTVTVCAAFIPNEKESGLRRHSGGNRSHSQEGSLLNRSSRIHAAASADKHPDLEAAEPIFQDSSSISINGSFKSNFKQSNSIINFNKKKSKSNTVHGKLVIVISDSGVGLSGANLKRLFKEVVQFNPEILQAGGGSGLGLWITNMIVAMHDGKISARSGGEGMGCSFTVEIDMHRKVVYPLLDSSLHQNTTILSPIRSPSRKHTGNAYMEDNNIFEDNALKASSDEDRRDDSNLAEALQRTVNLVDLPPQHLNKGNMLKYSADEERKGDPDVSEAFKQTVNPTDLPSQQLESKRGSISGLGNRRKTSTEMIGANKRGSASNRGIISSVGSRRKSSFEMIGSAVMEALSSYSSSNNSRRQSYCTKQKLDILIVDDSGLSRKMLSRLLRTSGHAYDVAEDGLLALDKVKAKMSPRSEHATNGSEKDSFDVILMDFVMPNMDGPTATKAIRDMGYTAPIFGLTGNALESDITYFLSCGANEVMTKPFDLSLFNELMKNYQLNSSRNDFQ